MNISDFSASANISMDDFVSIRKEYKEEYFYNLCSTQESNLQIKKLFLMLKTKQLFDNELLSAGLFSAIENKQEQYIDLIINFIEKNNIKLNEYQYNPLFNCSFKNKNNKLIEYFDDKFKIINKNLSEEIPSEIRENGIVYVSVTVCGGESDNYVASGNYLLNTEIFRTNPLKFAVDNCNEEMMNYILNKGNNKINPSVIKHILVESCISGNNEAALFLLSNNLIKTIIEESPNINLFLNQDEQMSEIKKEIKAALLMLELNDSLENKNNKTNKPKI